MKGTIKKRNASREKRLARAAREREILARFDLQNRPALLAARRARQAARRATTRRTGGHQS